MKVFQKIVIDMSRKVKVLKYSLNRCHLYLARVMKFWLEKNCFPLDGWRLAGWRNGYDI